MIVATDFAAARTHREGRVGLVPTMGYFHDGHVALMRAARDAVDTVVVSLFVNPLQFGPGEDLRRYPRDLERDAALAAAAGVDVLFAPPAGEMFAALPSTRVSVDALSQTLEGRFRPGHFEGVATVVAKLLAGLGPAVAFFGHKDAQQLAVVRRLVRDLSFPVEIAGVPTVREQDGLALSSRNTYLAPPDRQAATALSRGLFAAADLVATGERDAVALEEAVRAAAAAAPQVDLQYAELADAAETVRLLRLDREAFLAVAAVVGGTRLIDNVRFTPAGDGVVADRGVRLAGPSVLAERSS